MAECVSIKSEYEIDSKICSLELRCLICGEKQGRIKQGRI